MIKKILLLLAIFLLIESCGKRVITRKYYILEVPTAIDTLAQKEPISTSVCEVISVKMPPAYGQHRIAVRKRSHEISYYQYHHWAMDPGEIITALIEKNVHAASIFSQTSRFIWKVIPEFQIISAVHQLEAIDREDKFYAHLKMDLQLFDSKNKKVIATHEFDRKDPLSERDINLLAVRLSEILQQELSIFVEKMRHYFVDKIQS
jgi:ABC-type uncharacterized transport system auxiliary subunit